MPDDVEAVEQAGLLARNRHERRLWVSGPEADFGLAGRVVQRLEHGDWRDSRKRQRHRVVLGLVVNDVEIVCPLDGRRKIQQLVQLPRPHVLVLTVAVRVDRVERARGCGIAGREQRDVVAARHQPLGQQRRHRLHGPRPRGRDGRGDRSDVGDPQAAARDVQEPGKHDARVEVLARDVSRASRVPLVVGVDAIDAGERLVDRREGQESDPGRQMRSPAGVLHQRRAAGRQVAFGTIAEPPGPRRHVRVLRDAEFRLRVVDELAVFVRRTRDMHRIHRVPPVLAQHLLRPVDRELEALGCARRQVEVLQELLVLVASDVGEAFDLPGHDAGEPLARRFRRAPVVDRDRLPGVVPGEGAGGHRRAIGADVRTEGEQVIEALEKGDVPRLRLGDGELREGRIRIDEHFVRNARVLVAPEPRAAGQVDEEVGVRGVAPHLRRAPPVIRAVVVHEGPAVAEPEGCERVVDISGPVGRIRGARVLDRVIYALAGVLDVEDLVPEGPQTEEVHQRAPRDPAERVAGDDAREEDFHRRAAWMSSSTVSGSSSDRPTDSRAHIRL